MSESPKISGPTTRGHLSIGALSKATGIPVETLRTWERRYGRPAPARKPSGHRLYPAPLVPHLQRVARAIAGGHRAAEVLPLSLPELEHLLSRSPAPFHPLVDAAPVPPCIRELLEATRLLDGAALRAQLRQCAGKQDLLSFLEETAAPLMREAGYAWASGQLEIRHEHFASEQMGDLLREMRAPLDEVATGRSVALTSLPGDQHEGGLLMAALVFAMKGWRVIYLGVETPAAQVAALPNEADISAVGLGISEAVEKRGAARAVAEMRRLIPADVELMLGGGGAPTTLKGTRVFPDLRALHREI